MLGQTLVTHQTGPAGRVVNKVLVAESVKIAREIYFAVLLDRATAAPIIVASTEGGVEIETVAYKSPEKILREKIDPLAGLQAYQTRKLAKQLGFESSQLKAAAKLFDGLSRTFMACDCSMVEVNPLVVTPTGEVLALDAKFNFDDNALYRHSELRRVARYRGRRSARSRSFEARTDLHWPDGNIACFVNGATGHGDDGHHQVLRRQSRELSGSRRRRDGRAGNRSIQDPCVGRQGKGHPGEHFWGHHEMRRDCTGHIAAKTVNLSVPLVVRLEGTNVRAGEMLIAESGLAVITAGDLGDAAKKVAAAAASSNAQNPNPR
jgi:succinyl-CoA synthetase beta subunit